MLSFIALAPALIMAGQGAAFPYGGGAARAAGGAPHSITVPIAPSSGRINLPPIAGPADRSRPLVVIDPGHGGHDPGASNEEHHLREKDVTLALAKAVRDRIVAQGRVRVALTRQDDSYLSLQERYGLARQMGADLFLSLHADAADDGEAQGATIYTLSETASDREAARLAARENRSDIINGVAIGDQSGSVSSILIDLSQRQAMTLSASFAQLLYREASPFIRFRSRYHRFASLVVLKAPDIPSVLFEAGYITSAQDAAQLATQEGRDRVAQGIAQAVGVYFARRTAQP